MLLQALTRIDGIYATTPGAPTAYASTLNVVLMTSFNAAYLDLSLNWACHARAHGLRHLVWLQDRYTALRLQDRFGSAGGGTSGAQAKEVMVGSGASEPLATLFYSEHLRVGCPISTTRLSRGKLFGNKWPLQRPDLCGATCRTAKCGGHHCRRRRRRHHLGTRQARMRHRGGRHPRHLHLPPFGAICS